MTTSGSFDSPVCIALSVRMYAVIGHMKRKKQGTITPTYLSASSVEVKKANDMVARP